jgi:hypothetical protein
MYNSSIKIAISGNRLHKKKLKKMKRLEENL